MNDIFKKRRSVRKYSEETVSHDLLSQIVEAAGFAPSGMNSQSWQFIVLTGDALEYVRVVVRDYFRNLELTENHPPFFAKCKDWAEADDWSFFYHAPAFLVIANLADYRNAAADCAAAAENAILKATELNLGTCWITTLSGICDDPAVRAALKRLGLPETYRVFSSVAIGYAAESPVAAPRNYQVIWCDSVPES